MSNYDNREPGITVITVMRDLGIEPLPRTSWAIRDAVRDLWLARFGELPDKPLQHKTNAPGTHCIATYPTWFRPDIERVAKSVVSEKARQGELF